MKRNLKIVLVFVCAAAMNATAQDTELPAFNSLRTPTSPAFTVLSTSPSSVERPNTPASFALAISNAVTSFDSLPKGLAMEWAPYWGIFGDTTQFKNDIRRGVFESTFKTLSISLASTTSEINDKNVSFLSWGARTMLFSGQVPRDVVSKVRVRKAELDALSKSFSEAEIDREKMLNTERVRRLEECKGDTACEGKALKWYDEEKSNIDADKLKKVSDELKPLTTYREGFMLELAAAGAYGSGSGIWEDVAFTRFNAWITPAYVWKGFSLVGTGRYVDERVTGEAFEWGARMIYSNDRYAISFEYLQGMYLDTEGNGLPNRERYAGVGEYRLGENLWAQVTLGTDNKGLVKDNTILSMLGLSYNISGSRYKLD